jgi:putative transposase
VPSDLGRRSGPRRPARPSECGESEKSLCELGSVDGGYAGDETQRAAYEASRIRITVVKRADREVKGFIVLPKRWIVERTFGWVNRARRLAKDFEALITSSQAWFMLSLAFLLVRRIARDYENAA